MEETKPKKIGHSIMTKNVTQFRHLIKNGHTTENDITWAINLRQYDMNSLKLSKQGMAPQVYHKKTKLSQIRQRQFLTSKQKGFISFKCSQFSHMVPKFNQKTLKQSQSTIQFFASLRKNQQFHSKQNIPQFDNLAFKDRQQSPKILKTGSLKKTSNFKMDDFQLTLDGRQNYPQYTEKILKNKNYTLLKTFTQVKGRGRVNLPGLAWQVGLRDY